MLGQEICRQLVEGGAAVRALARNSSESSVVGSLERLGVEIVRGDVRDRESLVEACRGVEVVISTISALPTRYVAGTNDIAAVDQDGVMRLVDVARESGVQHFIYVSFTVDSPCPLRDAKREVERHVALSEMRYTVLRPSAFMEVWLGPMTGFDFPNARVRVLGSGEKPVSYISLVDVARFAVASIDNSAAWDTALSLGGPEPITVRSVIGVFEELTGRTFDVETVPEAALLEQQKAARNPFDRSMAALMLGFATIGDPVEMNGLPERFGVKLRSVRDYARDVLSVGGTL